MNVHQVAPRQPILLVTLTIDVALVAEAGIYDLLSRPPVSTELLRALQHIFAIETILNITTTTSARFLLRFFALLALTRPCTAFTRYVRNTITDG